MKWTTDAPRQEHAGRFFWLKEGDREPEVVLIIRWSGKNTMFIRVTPATTSDGESVYCRTYCIAHHESLSPVMQYLAARQLWAGPIELPEE